MKKRLNRVNVVVLLALFLVAGMNAQVSEGTSQDIVKAVKSGVAINLIEHFHEKIEFVLLGKTGVYSKNQAEMVLDGFYKDYPPTDFKIIHTGEKENASFSIGIYTSGRKTFRFTFLTKETLNKILIHQLRIETQDE